MATKRDYYEVRGVERGGSQEDFSRRISGHHCAGRQAPGCIARTPTVLRVERDGKIIDRPHNRDRGLEVLPV